MWLILDMFWTLRVQVNYPYIPAGFMPERAAFASSQAQAWEFGLEAPASHFAKPELHLKRLPI
jgi:hypothetical protein